MTVNIIGLTGPEHQDRKEVGTRDEDDDHSQGQGSWSFARLAGDNGIRSTPVFPGGKSNQAETTNNDGNKRLGTRPRELNSSC